MGKILHAVGKIIHAHTGNVCKTCLAKIWAPPSVAEAIKMCSTLMQKPKNFTQLLHAFYTRVKLKILRHLSIKMLVYFTRAPERPFVFLGDAARGPRVRGLGR